MISSGRHPGHYFLDREESLDIVRSGAVCDKTIEPNNTMVGRAGAVSEFFQGRVLLCGGRNHKGEVMSDCLAYKPRNNMWTEHSTMANNREEAATVVIEDKMYVLGGFVGDSRSDTADMLESERDSEWTNGPNLPEERARFCAVKLNGQTIAILGGETEEEMASATMKTYDLVNGDWTTQPEMRQKRKDHACLMTEVDGEKGVLVTGGVDENDNLLGSVEFYSTESELWSDLADLKHGRTEHGKLDFLHC